MAQEVRKKLYGDYDPYSWVKGKHKEHLQPMDDFGWFSEHKYFTDIINLDKPKLIVEVGSYLGKSARYMYDARIKHGEDFEIVCIDTWCGSEEHWVMPELKEQYRRHDLYEQFLSNAIHSGSDKHITPFRIDANSGNRVFRRLGIRPNLVYIDGAHDYASARRDIEQWVSVMPANACMIIDDIWYEDVRRAIADTIIASGKGVHSKDDKKFIWRKPA
jgi:Methyltransferase domain